ncbi:MAG: DUF6263 family protein [Flavobacteriales bacterium]|nr:DUF6263 family protein [Flavobacteriales bacterium]MCX7767591.1 DUF6263 family protein [Flavobacteriales bacterium]MDW8410237.1 DUF6263 family protein [Flavobacteriales bacterium]
MNLDFRADQNIETESMGQKMTIEQKMQFNIENMVEDISKSGNYIFKATYRRIKISQNLPGIGQTVVDTDSPSTNIGAAAAVIEPLFKSFIGKSFTMEMTPQGKAVRTDMSEIKALSPESGNLLEGDNGLFSGYTEFPDKSLKVGDSWEVERDLNSQKYLMRIKAKYTLKEVKDGLALIHLTGQYLPSDDKSSVSGFLEGDLHVDTQTGWTKEALLRQDLTFSSSELGLGTPLKIKSTITLMSN